jgi:C-3',4' desaturase CrtD
MKKIVVIGAGMGGLTVAARLAALGFDVTVLEAHVYPGGCAGTFYHQGYRFDAGATLAGGFYPGGPMDLVGRMTGIDAWPVHPAEAETMRVHLPDGAEIDRLSGEQRHAEHRAAFGRESLPFWDWQEQTADAVWSLALHLPSWPPQSGADLLRLGGSGLSWLVQGNRLPDLPGLARDAFQPLSVRLKGLPERLRLFVDAQLLISAQATSQTANALYGAAALDLPRRGVVHPREGMGALARRLAQAVEENGGRVLYRQEAVRIRRERSRPVSVETKRGGSFPADLVIANLPPWNIAALLEGDLPHPLQNLPLRPPGWGAFMLYAGIEHGLVPPGFPLHHQVVRGVPLGEGASAFLSLSPAWDRSRAPAGMRAVTISTHTGMDRWWQLYEKDPQGYEALKNEYTHRLLQAAEQILPGFTGSAALVMPGTPVSFQRFTRRASGWVGGFPQTSLFQSPGPRLADGLWMVGDSIFPGQSTAAAALGGLRVAAAIEHSAGLRMPARDLVQTETS